MRYSIQGYGVTISFDEKPDERIRHALKANGFRWNPKAGLWWRNRVTGAADVIGAIQKMLRPANEPDGSCWGCGEPGRFRQFGAATPVMCDGCFARRREGEKLPCA